MHQSYPGTFGAQSAYPIIVEAYYQTHMAVAMENHQNIHCKKYGLF
jgi:hypothetical protein